MNYKFTKEVVSIGHFGKTLRLYKVFDQQDQLAGQFAYHPKKQTLHFDEREISVEVVSKFLKKRKYFLVDKKENKQVGEYKVFGGKGFSHFWQDVPSFPTGTIQIGETVFNFRRMPTDINHSLFDRDTWGHFKFRLYAIKGTEFYEYALKIDVPFWRKSNNTRHQPFQGTIESNSDNIFAILAGFYLMEVEFKFEDTKDGG